MKARKLGFGLAIIALSAVAAKATPLPRYGVFVFSNLCIHPDSGDILGERLTLIRLNGDDAAFFEWGEGELTSGWANTVKVGPAGRLVITITPSDTDPVETHTIKGVLSTENFTLTDFRDSGDSSGKLLRVMNLGQKFSLCR